MVLTCPNPGLLTQHWDEIIGYVNKAKSKNEVLKRLRRLAKDYGEINRGYSVQLPIKHFLRLQKRISEIERLTRYIVKNSPDLSPEFKVMLKDIRGNFSGREATNVRRKF